MCLIWVMDLLCAHGPPRRKGIKTNKAASEEGRQMKARNTEQLMSTSILSSFFFFFFSLVNLFHTVFLGGILHWALPCVFFFFF